MAAPPPQHALRTNSFPSFCFVLPCCFFTTSSRQLGILFRHSFGQLSGLENMMVARLCFYFRFLPRIL